MQKNDFLKKIVDYKINKDANLIKVYDDIINLIPSNYFGDDSFIHFIPAKFKSINQSNRSFLYQSITNYIYNSSDKDEEVNTLKFIIFYYIFLKLESKKTITKSLIDNGLLSSFTKISVTKDSIIIDDYNDNDITLSVNNNIKNEITNLYNKLYKEINNIAKDINFSGNKINKIKKGNFNFDDIIKKIEENNKIKDDLTNLIDVLKENSFIEWETQPFKENKNFSSILINLYLFGNNSDFNHFYYINSITEKNVERPEFGTFVFSSSTDFNKNEILSSKILNNFFWSYLSILELDIINDELKKHAIKSAIAAIMARNGSHNIGSHVLSALSYNLNDPTDMQVFSQYLQERMDFVAQITTEIPNWTIPTRFVSQLMRNFYMQRILLKYIVESEGLTAKEYNKFDAEDKGKLQIIIQDRDGEEITGGINKDTITDDPLVAIPGGVTGTHAFYTILENIIRNAAKHSYSGADTDKTNGLKLYIKIDDITYDKYVCIQIYDNVTQNIGIIEEKKDLIEILNKKLNTSFINKEDGSLIYKSWGIAEMKIGAGYLNLKPTEVIGGRDKDKIREFIKAVKIGETNFIGYQIKIPKPKHLLIIDESAEDSDLENNGENGIYIKNLKNQESFDYEFVLIKKLELDKFKQIKDKLPARVFICNNGIIINDEETNVDSGTFIKLKNNSKENSNKLITELYKIWIKSTESNNKENSDKLILKLYKIWVQELLKDKNLQSAELNIKPYDNGISGGSSINEDKIYRSVIKKLILKNKISDKEGVLSTRLKINEDIDENTFDNDGNLDVTITTKNQIKELAAQTIQFYYKYKEDIETLPKNLMYKITEEITTQEKFTDKIEREESEDEENKTPLSEIEKKNEKINYVRHKGGDGHYSEALSGSQSYFNDVLNLAKEENTTGTKLSYGLIENGLLNITILDERVYKYYTEADSTVRRRFNSIQLNIGDIKNNKLHFINDNELKTNNVDKKDILIIHQGILDKLNISEKSKKWKVLKEKFTYIFVTSGRGKPEEGKLLVGTKFIPFSNIRVSLMQQYPEKYLLTQSLMKIYKNG